MQFEEVLSTFIEFFKREEIRYAVIGELALQAHGVRYVRPRIEFAVESSARDRVIAHMTALGFRTTYASSRCSVHTNDGALFDKVAFVYATRKFDAIPAPLCGLPWVAIAHPDNRFALSEADVDALDAATLRLGGDAWIGWIRALSANLPPSRETNSDSDEPFVL